MLENFCLFVTPTKNRKNCNTAVDNCPHALEFVQHCFKTQKLKKMCNKVGNTYPSVIQFFPDQN